MGRQAHLARLALGRSPFEAPEVNSDGNFTLGLQSHELDNADHYSQHYDERGHPQNYTSRSLDREFRLAKNDALETVGVVVRKNKAEENTWQKKTKGDKILLVSEENEYGFSLVFCDTLLRLPATWWINSLRGRVQTFRSFQTLPLIEIIKSEFRILGIRQELSSGFLSRAVWLMSIRWAGAPLDALGDLVERFTETNDSRDSHNIYSNIAVRAFEAAYFIMMMPISYLSLLQSLHLLPAGSTISLLSFIPFTRDSPLHLPPLPTDMSSSSLRAFAISLALDPFVLDIVYGLLWTTVKIRSFAVLRRLTIQPDGPDSLSMAVARADGIYDGVLPGLLVRSSADANRQNLFDILKMEFPRFHRWFKGGMAYMRLLAKVKSPAVVLEEPDPALYRRLVDLIMIETRNARRSGTEITEPERAAIQLRIVEQACEERGLEYLTDIGDLSSFMREIWMTQDDASTTTPDPGELFDLGEFIRDDVFAGNIIANEAIPAPPEDAEPVDAIVMLQDALRLPDSSQEDQSNTDNIGRIRETWDRAQNGTEIADNNQENPETSAENSTSVGLETAPPWPPVPISPREWDVTGASTLNSPRLSRPSSHPRDSRRESPSPGISRARSLPHDLLSVSSPPGTELSRRVLSGGSRRMLRKTTLLPLHRVTALSYFSANSFASHTASLIATAVTLPIESLLLRSLALRFLDTPAGRPGATAAALGIRRDVRGLHEWFGAGSGSWQYIADMLLLLGMQGLTSSAIWAIMTMVSTRAGRHFGWGEF